MWYYLNCCLHIAHKNRIVHQPSMHQLWSWVWLQYGNFTSALTIVSCCCGCSRSGRVYHHCVHVHIYILRIYINVAYLLFHRKALYFPLVLKASLCKTSDISVTHTTKLTCILALTSSLINTGVFFTYPEHLGLSLSTHGVPVFKSSPDSLWPVYLTINNLSCCESSCSQWDNLMVTSGV